jgi:hypothetical protein
MPPYSLDWPLRRPYRSLCRDGYAFIYDCSGDSNAAKRTLGKRPVMSSGSLKKMGTLKKAEAASLQQVQRWLEDLGLSPDRPEDQVCVSLFISLCS